MRCKLNSAEAHIEQIEDSILINVTSTNMIYSIDGIEFKIVDALIKNPDVEELIHKLQDDYDEDQEIIAEDVYSYIEALLDARIFIVEE